MFDIVLIVVDRYIKFAKYIPACKDWKAEDIANVLIKEIFIKYNNPVFFVSNCDSLFMSKFWLHLCYYVNI